MSPRSSSRDPKREVRRAFGRSAPRYDRFARLQRQVADRLLAALPERLPPGWLADLGSGTGYVGKRLLERYPGRRLLFLDLADAMVRRTGGVVGDLEALPLQNQSLALACTSLALQWCPNLERALSELLRVVRPGGVLAFATLTEGTLRELDAAWRAVDGSARVNRFVSFNEIKLLLEGLGWVGRLFREERVLAYRDPLELLFELKGLGTRNLNPSRPRGLTPPGRLREMAAAYRELCRGRIVATFEMVYGIGGRSENKA